MPDTVLISGARAPVAQDIARAFKAAGAQVHLVDSVTPWAASAIKPGFDIHKVARPRQTFTTFRADLLRLVKTLKPSLIIPTCEEVFWVVAAAERDHYLDRVFAPPLETLRKLHSKFEFIQLARNAGLNTVDTYCLDAEISSGDLPFKLEDSVFKPEFSRFATHTLIGPKSEALKKVTPTRDKRWVVQKRIRGEEFCSYAAIHQGRISAFAAYRPRWRQGNAAAFQMEAVSHSGIQEITEKIADLTGMSGHLSFDVVVDEHGVAWPIECNPRAVSGVHLFDAAPELAHAIRCGMPCETPKDGELRHMSAGMWMLGAPSALFSGKLPQFVRDWRTSEDIIDREGNLLTQLGCLADAVRFTWQAMRNGISPAGATTADIEWDGEPIP